jgi:hypothetical protein
VVLISYRHFDPFPLSTSVSSTTAKAELAARRQHWLSARKETLRVTNKEQKIYSSWEKVNSKSPPRTSERLPHPSSTLHNISPLFFTISAKIAGFINQGISEQWAELAAEFLLQAALESCRTSESSRSSMNTLAIAFAWGWIPSAYWDDAKSDDEAGIETEKLINTMFAVENGDVIKENEIWERTRRKYISNFSRSLPKEPGVDGQSNRWLTEIVTQHPMPEFEKKVVAFSKAMWEFCRKPLLVQIEEGGMEGMTSQEFDDLKKRVFLPL